MNNHIPLSQLEAIWTILQPPLDSLGDPQPLHTSETYPADDAPHYFFVDAVVVEEEVIVDNIVN